MSVHCNIKMTIKKKHGPKGTGDEIAGSFLPTATAALAVLQSHVSPTAAGCMVPHCTTCLRGKLKLRHIGWVCWACLHQLNFLVYKKNKTWKFKGVHGVVHHLSADCRVPEELCLQSFILDLDINLGNCIKIISRNALDFSTVTSHSISLSLKIPFFNSLY